jgi:predicted RNA-binding Zn-ribbon protein involved in translation (DUF1610 family)
MVPSESQRRDTQQQREDLWRREICGPRLAPAAVVTRYSCPVCGGPHSRAEHGTRETGEESG